MCSLYTGDTVAFQWPGSGAGWLRWPELGSPWGQGLSFPTASVTGRKTSRTPEARVVPPGAALEGPASCSRRMREAAAAVCRQLRVITGLRP